MEELLKKLLEAQILSEDSKKELEEAVKKQLEEAVNAAKKEAEDTVRAQLAEQWIAERDALIEAIDQKVTEFCENELSELKGDISSFRDLEAEYAKKLVEAKGEMGEQLQKDLKALVEKLDAFLEIRIAAEFEELREDIEEARKLEFGRKLYEAFSEEYRKHFVDEFSVEAELRETQEQLDTLKAKYEAEVGEKAVLSRKIKMESVLKPLSGTAREVMETILSNVATEQLEEGYRTFIGRVLKEDVTVKSNKKNESKGGGSEKENKVLAESANISSKVDEGSVILKTGDSEVTVVEESVSQEPTPVQRIKSDFLKLAGMTK